MLTQVSVCNIDIEKMRVTFDLLYKLVMPETAL